MCPCMECNKRELACHDRCDDYKNWCIKRNELKEVVARNSMIDREVDKFSRYTRFRIKFRRDPF